MTNLLTYVEETMDPISKLPFNRVDSLVLSQLSYARFEGLVPGLKAGGHSVPIRDLLKAEYFDSLFSVVLFPEKNRELLFALAASPRFRELKINFYESRFSAEKEEQFSAVTFLLDDDTAYLAFRGTDTTLVGWREDFNMAFQTPVPAQTDAVDYARETARLFPGKLRIGGHSKGGNLAVYCASECGEEIGARVLDVFSHDGPGFQESFFQGEGYQRISGRIQKTVPQTSVIGMLLESQEPYIVVESTGFGLLQHDPFTWVVENGDFKVLDTLTENAKHLDRTLNTWLSGLDQDQRAKFVGALFQILDASGAKRVSDLEKLNFEQVSAMAAAFVHLDAQTRRSLLHTVKELALLSIKPVPAAKQLSPGAEEEPAPEGISGITPVD